MRYHVVIFRVVDEAHQELLLALERNTLEEHLYLLVNRLKTDDRLVVALGKLLEVVVERLCRVKATGMLERHEQGELCVESLRCDVAKLSLHDRVAHIGTCQVLEQLVESCVLFFGKHAFEFLAVREQHGSCHFLYTLWFLHIFHVELSAYLFGIVESVRDTLYGIDETDGCQMISSYDVGW